MRVDLTYGRWRQSFVQRLHGRIERFEFGIVGDRFVEQIVADHRGVVAVMPRESLPDRDRMLLGAGVAEEPGIPVAVVDILSGLASRRGMQIKDDVEILLMRPLNKAVK